MSEFIIECEYDSDEGWIPGEHREEIVRCRDCIYYTDDEMEFYHYCNRRCEQVELDGFCKWGESETINKTDDIVTHDSRAELTCIDANEDERDFTCSECGASMYTQVDDCWTMIARGGLRDDVIERPNYCPNCGARVVVE